MDTLLNTSLDTPLDRGHSDQPARRRNNGVDRTHRAARASEIDAPHRRHDATLFVAIVAAVATLATLVVATALHDGLTSNKATAVSPGSATGAPVAPQAAPAWVIDHGVIAPDAPSAGDAETVEASIAAYER